MSVISIISFSLCLIILIYSLRKGTDLFSPAKVFSIIWTVSIGLADLKLSRLQHEWSGYGWLMLGIGIASFLTGTFVVYVIYFRKKFKTINEIRLSYSDDIVDQRVFLRVIIIVFIIYFISYLGNYLIEGYLPVFHKNAGQSRMGWGVFGIGLTIHTATPLLLMVVIYLRLVRPTRLLKTALICMIFFTFISYLFLLQRFNLMFAIVAILVFLYYSSNFLRPRNAILSILVIVGLIYSVQFLRMSSLALTYLFTLAKMKFSFRYAIFTEPYMYIAMNLENFTRAVDRLETHTYGYYTFNFITSLSGTKKTLTEYLSLNPFPFINSSYNTYSMFWDFYRDFGILGLGIIPFVIGFFISAIYYNMKMKPSLVNLSGYSVCVFIIFMSFFANVIGLLHFVFNFSLIIILAMIVQRKLIKINLTMVTDKTL